jgi:hypothetical protein
MSQPIHACHDSDTWCHVTCQIHACICKPFVIPYQYPTLILVGSDLTFTVSNPKKMVGHKIRMHRSKFRPNKNQCRWRKIPQHPNLGSTEFLCTLSSDLNISQYLTLKIHNSDIRYWIASVRVVSIHKDPSLTVNAHHKTRYQHPWFCNHHHAEDSLACCNCHKTKFK